MLSGVASDTNWHVYSSSFAGASSVLWLNGNQIKSGNVGSQTLTRITIGVNANMSSSCWVGDVTELLVYNSALSVANRQSVETYLNMRWAIY